MQLQIPDCKLSNDLDNLLNESSFADCTFAVEGDEFKAHKAIVAGWFLLCILYVSKFTKLVAQLDLFILFFKRLNF